MPIVSSVQAIVHDGVSPQQAVETLISRALCSELPESARLSQPPAMDPNRPE